MAKTKQAIEAVQGTQAGKPYWAFMLPLLDAVSIIKEIDETDVAPEKRAQRKLTPSRAKNVGAYVMENRDTYILPAITVTIKGEAKFSKAKGSLTVGPKASYYPNDGQTRLAGIRMVAQQLSTVLAEAEPSEPEAKKQWKQQQKDAKAALAFLASETIAVTAYPWESVKVNQQRFTDINKNSSKPNSAISMLFDHRDPVAGMARMICSTVLDGKVELTKSSVGRASGFLFSINAVRKAVLNLGEPDHQRARRGPEPCD